MKGTRKLMAVLAAGLIMMPSLAQARHNNVSGAVTVVHSDRSAQNKQVKGGTETKFLERVKNILQMKA